MVHGPPELALATPGHPMYKTLAPPLNVLHLISASYFSYITQVTTTASTECWNNFLLWSDVDSYHRMSQKIYVIKTVTFSQLQQ